MAEDAQSAVNEAESPGRLDALAAATRGSARLPKEAWNPPFCGDIPMRIARDGSWHYAGSPIARPALVRLFASVLRREDARFVLVTPVEKVGIEVEDAPFVATEMEWAGSTLRLRTNLDEWVDVDTIHPLRFEDGPAGGLKPYVRVRDDLWALLTRTLATELIDRGEVRDEAGAAMFGIASGPHFFAIGPADRLDDDAI
jgi:hypothetical protein